MTVVDKRWWLNAKVDGTGVLLHDLAASGDVWSENVADAHPVVVRDLFAKGCADAEGGFPEFLMDLARNQMDAPGCSALAARA